MAVHPALHNDSNIDQVGQMPTATPFIETKISDTNLAVLTPGPYLNVTGIETHHGIDKSTLLCHHLQIGPKKNHNRKEKIMLETIQPSAANIVAVRATGKVTGDDYETILIPLIEEKLTSRDKIRLLYHLGPEFEGYEAGAMWDDTKVGLKHLTHFEKIAMVTDVNWVIRLVKAAGFLIPGEVRLFANSDLPAAQDWISH